MERLLKIGLVVVSGLVLGVPVQAWDIVVDAHDNCIAISPEFPGGEPVWIPGITSHFVRFHIVENNTHWYPGSPHFAQVCLYLQNVLAINGVPVSQDLQVATLAEGDTLDVEFRSPENCERSGSIGAFLVDAGNNDNSGQMVVACEALYDGNFDHFETLDHDTWAIFGSPDPSIDSEVGVPAPSLKGNGDNSYSEGVYTRGCFAAGELVVEASMFNDADPYVNGARCGLWLVEVHGGEWDEQQFEAGYWCAMVHLNPSPGDNATRLGIWNGSAYIERYDFIDDCEWHRWRIEVNQDLTVSFFRDHELFYQTTEQLPGTVCYQVCLVTGRRSWHDEITLCAGQCGVPEGAMLIGGSHLDIYPSLTQGENIGISFATESFVHSGQLLISDVQGRVVRDIQLQGLAPGPHVIEWDRISTSGHRVGSGVYFVRVRLDNWKSGARRVVVMD